MYKIYAVRDKLADDFIGGLHLHRHDAPAIRMFSDGIQQEGTVLNLHPHDYELICLGDLSRTLPASAEYIDPMDTRIVITGSALVASSAPPEASE